MKNPTVSVLQEYFKTKIETKSPILVRAEVDTPLLKALAAEDPNNTLGSALQLALGDEIIRSLNPDATFISLLTPGYLAIDKQHLTCIVVAAMLRGIELGQKISEVASLENLFTSSEKDS